MHLNHKVIKLTPLLMEKIHEDTKDLKMKE